LPENVEAARREIENHIYQRTGNMPITDPNASIANFDLNVRRKYFFNKLNNWEGVGLSLDNFSDNEYYLFFGLATL